MPCYDPETHERPIRLAEKIHYLTELLCTLCAAVQKSNPQFLPRLPEVREWWVKHEEFDRAGAEIAKRVEQHGLNSLTQQERSHYHQRDRNDPENP
jgi:hypothetical protein